MEKQDVVRDELLKKLAGRIPLDSPSEDFTLKVMAGISSSPEQVKARKPFYLFLKSSGPWILLGLFVIIFLLSSDIPYLSFLPGKDYVSGHILPYFSRLLNGTNYLFTVNTTFKITMALLASGALLVAVDWLMRRHRAARHHTA